MESTWLWGILGLILLAVEMATGTFYILWFGIAALIGIAVTLFICYFFRDPDRVTPDIADAV
ncbi:MAG: NfeD family protein, partial [Nitrosomonadales bacterium]|nr:NfeD family protein [Nitrosomonadales bacterium]